MPVRSFVFDRRESRLHHLALRDRYEAGPHAKFLHFQHRSKRRARFWTRSRPPIAPRAVALLRGIRRAFRAHLLAVGLNLPTSRRQDNLCSCSVVVNDNECARCQDLHLGLAKRQTSLGDRLHHRRLSPKVLASHKPGVE